MLSPLADLVQAPFLSYINSRHALYKATDYSIDLAQKAIEARDYPERKVEGYTVL